MALAPLVAAVFWGLGITLAVLGILMALDAPLAAVQRILGRR